MVGIAIGKNFLELPEDFTIGFDFLHPAFSDTVLGGGYSFPIDIPMKGRNPGMLNFPGMPENYLPVYEFECFVHDGSHTKKGKLIIDRPGSEVCSGYININIRAFDILDRKMSEVNYGGAIYMGANQDAVLAFAKNAVETGNWQNPGFDFPMIQNPDFYGDANADFSGFINYWNKYTQTFVKNQVGGLGDPVNVNCLVPVPYFPFLLKKIMAMEGFELDVDSVESDYPKMVFDRMLIYNNFALDRLGNPLYKVNVKLGAPTVYNGGTGGVLMKLDTEVEDASGVFDNTAGHYSYLVSAAVGTRASFDATFKFVNSFSSPSVNVRIEILLNGVLIKNYNTGFITEEPITTHTISDAFTIAFLAGDLGHRVTYRIKSFGSFGTRAVYVNMLSHQVRFTPLEGNNVNEMENSMDIKNHVPDMTVREFLTAARDTFGLSFLCNPFNQKGYIRQNLDALKGKAVDDITRKADVADQPASPNELRLKMRGYNWGGDDAQVQDNFKKFDTGLDIGAVDRKIDLPSPDVAGQTIRVEETGERYITIVNQDTGVIEWEYLRDDYDDLWYDITNSVEMRMGITPIFMRYADNPLFVSEILPTVKGTGSSLGFPIGVNLAAPRFFWKISNNRSGIAVGDFEYCPESTSRPTFAGEDMALIGGRLVEGELYDVHKDWDIKILNQLFLWLKDVEFDVNDIGRLEDHLSGQFWMRQLYMKDVIIKRITVSMSKETGVSVIEYLKKG